MPSHWNIFTLIWSHIFLHLIGSKKFVGRTKVQYKSIKKPTRNRGESSLRTNPAHFSKGKWSMVMRCWNGMNLLQMQTCCCIRSLKKIGTPCWERNDTPLLKVNQAFFLGYISSSNLPLEKWAKFVLGKRSIWLPSVSWSLLIDLYCTFVLPTNFTLDGKWIANWESRIENSCETISRLWYVARRFYLP